MAIISLHNITVLIADANPSLRKSLKSNLENLRFLQKQAQLSSSVRTDSARQLPIVIHEVRTGEEALLKVENHKIALIISGRDLSDMKGADLLMKIRQDARTQNLPFILATPSSDKIEILRAIELGVSAYLLLPSNLEGLEQCLKDALSRTELDLVSWSDGLSVGVPELDDQHKKLIHLINALHAAIIRGQGRELISWVVSELVSYTETHFKDEESLLLKHDYPDLKSHQLKHTQLLKQVAELKQRVETTNLDTGLSVDTLQFLKSWLTGHILGSDKNYTSHLKEKM